MEDNAVQALSKVIGLMPPRLRRQMDALRSQTERLPWSGGPSLDPTLLSMLAQACRDSEPIRFTYEARNAEPTDRWVEPHRMVTIGRRWYLVAYDRDRHDWRSYRVDRITGPATTGARFRQRTLPAEDAASFVRAGIRSMPTTYDIQVTIDAPAEVVRQRVQQWGTVTATGDARCRLEMHTDWLEWPLMIFGSVGAPFEIHSPPELVREVERIGALFAGAAGGPR